MYTHMYTYLDIHMYIYMYVCMYVCMHACMYVCMYVYICTNMYIHVHIHVYIYTQKRHTRLLQAIRYVLNSSRYWWDSRNRHDESRNMLLPHVVKPEMDVNILVQSQTNGKLKFPPTVFDKRCMRNWKGGVFPHITVWDSCFLLGSRRLPPPSASPPLTLIAAILITAILITPLISPPSHSHTHHSNTHRTTHLTSLITALLITTPLSHHLSHLTHHTTTPHSTPSHTSPITALLTEHSQHPFSHLPHHSIILTIDNSSQLAFAPLGRGWISCGRRGTQSLRRAVAAFGVACAAHRSFWWSWGAHGRCLGRGWLSCGKPSTFLEELSCGRRSTQSLLEELLRAWSPLARGCLSCGKRSTWRFLEE